MVISSFHPVAYKGSSSQAPCWSGLGEEVTEGRPYLPWWLPGVIWLVTWLMGGHRGSSHAVLHSEDSFIFNTIECLSQSVLCGEDWLSLCGVSWEGFPLLPLQTGICSSSCLLQLVKERASFFLFLFSFFLNQWIDGCGVKCGLKRSPLPHGRIY